MKRVAVISVVVFMASGLIGPLLRLVTWPPGPTSSSSSNFLYDLILLLWPAQLFALMEYSTGRVVAIALATLVNVIFFAIIGAIIGTLAKRVIDFVAAFLVVCALVFLFALWTAGFSFSHVNLTALVVAFLVYAVSFVVLYRLTHKGGSTAAA